MNASAPEASRLEPIPTLPVFFKLRGKRVLMAGGGPPAVWKTELLVAAGALVEVVALQPCPDLRALAAASDPEAVRLAERPWTVSDFRGVAMAIGDIEDDEEAERFRRAARAEGVPVNVIDKPDFCDFQFGTLIVRSPLVIAITTDGAAPVFGQALRTRLETVLPGSLRAWTRAAKDWRPAVRARDWSFAKRRRFWEIMAERALRPEGSPPDEATRQSCFDAAEQGVELTPTALALVGCGAGTPDELTFAAARLLQNADVIIHDVDVAVDTAQMGRREANKVIVADDDQGMAAALAQPRSGRRIVWLGTGNPDGCLHWEKRRALLARHFPDLTVLPGLDRCSHCANKCQQAGRMSGLNEAPGR